MIANAHQHGQPTTVVDGQSEARESSRCLEEYETSESYRVAKDLRRRDFDAEDEDGGCDEEDVLRVIKFANEHALVG